MAEQENRPRTENPTEVARETLRQLALRRIAPTPDNYRKLYQEITGDGDSPAAASALKAFASGLRVRYPALPAAAALDDAVRLEKWPLCKKLLDDIVACQPQERGDPGVEHDENTDLALLKEMLARTLEYLAAGELEQDARMAEQTRRLIARITEARKSSDLKKIAADLKKLWLDIELRSTGRIDQLELLKRLLRLLMENIGELLDDDAWLRGQLDTVREALSGPPHPQALLEAEQRIKEIIFKQGLVKHGLREATATLKATMKTFVDRLGDAVAATGDYQEKISGYAERIGRASGVHELQTILDNIMHETRSSQASARTSYDALLHEKELALRAEERIRELEARLARMSTLVREDPMTQSLNRRGMEDEMAREIERSNLYGTPFCIVVIDVDNFKQVNDAYGHQTGDQALIHLVNVAKEELRMLDQVARVGGEEFLIVLPNTAAEEACRVVERLQRALTKKFFLNNNDRILITFSAGVAQHAPEETQGELFRRADEAMYEAKKSGKNRVCLARGLAPES